MNISLTIFISLLGGLLPSFVWLWFWMKEDKLHPEPRSRLALIFLGGMAAVLLVLPVEKFIFSLRGEQISGLTIFYWAAAEELFKFLVAYFFALRLKYNDEPIDAVIYMITVALGFSALENSLFLSNLVNGGHFAESIISGNMRFLGATLLHIASSATIGIMYGLAFYQSKILKRITLLFAISTSIILHTIFNLLIIESGNKIFFVFSGVWMIITFIIVAIEKVKKTHI